jgi:hypothetical protein
MCVGESLEIGVAFRGSVVRQDTTNQPTTWLAAVNAGYLGEYFDRAAANALSDPAGMLHFGHRHIFRTQVLSTPHRSRCGNSSRAVNSY